MRKNTIENFWLLVKRGSSVKCWPWLGGKFKHGYGRFSIDGKSKTTHRMSFELKNGRIKSGLCVMHKCNNKLCCNPAHLKLGTILENTRHASSSGSFKAGSSRIRGVGFIANRGYWHSQGWIKGKRYNLYTGPSKEKAVAARKKWEEKYKVSFNLENGE